MVCTSLQVNTVVFDKTGTLTHGKPEVTSLIKLVSDKVCPKWLLLVLVKMAEENSEHPLGLAITRFVAQWMGKESIGMTDSFEVFPGRGLKAVVTGNFSSPPVSSVKDGLLGTVVRDFPCINHEASLVEQGTITDTDFPDSKLTVLIGNRNWMSANNIVIPDSVHSEMTKYECNAQTVVLVAIQGNALRTVLITLFECFLYDKPASVHQPSFPWLNPSHTHTHTHNTQVFLQD